MARVLQIYAAEQLFRQQVDALFDALPAARFTGSKVYDPPSIAAGDVATTTVTVTGATLGSQAGGAFSLDLAGLYLTASVTAANTVTVTLVNPTAAPIDLASGTLSAFAWSA